MTIENLAAADDDLELITVNDAITITAFGIRCRGTCTTTASTTISDILVDTAMTKGQLAATTGTSTMTFNSVTANGALSAGNTLIMDTTNTPSPETDEYHICIQFTYDRQ